MRVPSRMARVQDSGSRPLRMGELLDLKLSDVDFKAGTDALLTHLAARPSKEWLFTMEEGEPLNYRRWKAEWNCVRRTLQAAGNEAAGREGRKPVELPHMVTHDLRHSYAFALIAGGASVEQVRLVLGHASAVNTPRIHAHLWPGEEDRTRAVMDAVLGGLRPGCGHGDTATKEIAGQKR